METAITNTTIFVSLGQRNPYQRDDMMFTRRKSPHNLYSQPLPSHHLHFPLDHQSESHALLKGCNLYSELLSPSHVRSPRPSNQLWSKMGSDVAGHLKDVWRRYNLSLNRSHNCTTSYTVISIHGGHAMRHQGSLTIRLFPRNKQVT